MDSSSNMDNSLEVTENVAPSKVASRRPTDSSSDAFKTRSPLSYNNYVSIKIEFSSQHAPKSNPYSHKGALI